MPSIRIVPFVGQFVSLLEADTRDYGLQAAVANAVKRSESRIRVLNARHDLLMRKPVLLVANHPHSAEVLALIRTLPNRRDIYVVISHKFTRAGRSISSHCIPVYLSHHHMEGRPVTVPGRIVDFFLKPETLTPEQEHELNIRSIDEAAQKINRGALVIIFPERRFGKRRWQPGLGHLLKKLDGNAQLVLANVSGTSLADYFRLLPKAGKVLPQISVQFHDPIAVREINTRPDARRIVEGLEEYYSGWAGSLKQDL